jgi:hypothetical protein
MRRGVPPRRVATAPAKFRPEACPTCGTPHAIIDGAWLAAERHRAGLTIRAVAEVVGVSVAYLCDIEHNRRNCPAHVREAYEAIRGAAS